MIPEPTEADLALDLQRAWNCSAFVDPPEAMRQVIRRCHAAESQRDKLRADLNRLIVAVWHSPSDPKPTTIDDIDQTFEETVQQAAKQSAAFDAVADLRAEVKRVREMELAKAQLQIACDETRAAREKELAGEHIPQGLTEFRMR